jgi:uncharacterized protein (TIGR03067 family)
MTAKESCPSAKQLQGLLTGQAPADEQANLANHLETCENCRQTLEELVAGSQSWSAAARQLKEEAPGVDPKLRQIMDKIKSEGRAGDTQDAVARDEELSLDFLSPPEGPGHLGRLGHYEVLEVIGRGGMGVVLKGFDTVLRRIVAIKVLAPQLATTSAARKRFEREGQAAAAIDHEHIVAIYAVDKTAGGLPYIVMEYVAGVSLQERLDRTGPMELKEILRIGLQTARGLAAAHAQGLVHRDIKPANILLHNGVERVKITDFGLARIVDDASLTQSGIVAGTPQFMAPEQARGEAVDHRADLFSLGSVLYVMCAGRPPFRASSALAVLKRVSEETPRPLPQVNPAIPPWLVEIIEKLHAKDPADRFQSASEVAELLGQHLAHLQQPGLVASGACQRPGTGVITDPARHDPARQLENGGLSSRYRRWVVAAVILLLIAGGLTLTDAAGVTNVSEFLGTVLRIRTPSGTLVVEVDDPQVEVTVDGEEVSIHGAGLQEIRVKPGEHRIRARKDGKPVPVDKEIVTITRGGKQVVRVSREDSGKDQGADIARPGSNPAGVGRPGFHPTEVARPGSHLAGVTLLDGSSSRVRVQAHISTIRGLAFSPDGKILASVGGEFGDHPGEITLWYPATGKVMASQLEKSAVLSAAFSPGSMTLATGQWDGTVKLRDGKKGTVEAVLRGHTGPVNSVAFAPDGQTLASGSSDKTIKIWRLGTRELLETVPSGTVEEVYSVAFSPDGKTLAIGGGHIRPDWPAIAGKPIVGGGDRAPTAALIDVGSWRVRAKLAPHTGTVSSVAFSPDGQRLGTAAYDWVWLWHVGDPDRHVSLKPPGFVFQVAFSPDGNLLAAAGADQTVTLWDFRIKNRINKLMSLVGQHKGNISAVAFSSDSKILAWANADHTIELRDLSALPPPAADSDMTDAPEKAAERMFRRLDRNGDGLLNDDEMPEGLRAERDKWDTNKDGFIDLNEFKAYFRARFQQWKGTKQGSERKADNEKVRQLLKDRLVTLEQIADETVRKFQAGAASEEDLLQAQLGVHKAKLELAESDQERVKVQEEIVTLSKKTEEYRDKLYQAGRISSTDLLKVRADRLQAEKELQELRQKLPESAKPKGDLEKIQGDWVLLWAERDGKPRFTANDQERSITFQDNKLLTRGPGGTEGTFQLQPREIPKVLEITQAAGPSKTKTMKGIYDLEGDKLTICLNEKSGGELPHDFATTTGSGLELMVFQRVLGEKVIRPSGEEAAKAARAQLQSIKNLQKIGLAMHSFHDVHHHFPPTALYGNGKPLLSWRVVILPFLGEEELYKEFKLEEPWDSPHNRKLLAKIPKVYAFPIEALQKDGRTLYRALAGMVAEAGEPVPWTQPEELVYEPGKPLPKLARIFPDRFHVLMRDGSVHAVKKDGFDEEKMRALLLFNEGKTTDIDELK